MGNNAVSRQEYEWPDSTRVEGNLAETIEKSHAQLFDLLECLDAEQSYEELKDALLDRVERGLTAEDLWQDLMLKYFNQSDPDHYFIPIIISCAYNVQARRAMDSGLTEKAWFFLTEGSYYRGLAEGKSVDENTLKIVEQRHENGRKGGFGKAQKIKPARDEVVRLLHEKRPPAGWETKVQAADTIVGDLMKFVTDKKIPLTLSNLPKKLKEWLSQDTDVCAAFDATKHP
ncbi:hypothetical protein OI25_2982 [Paraburkholderia fungorum]|jgi:hypothetical protein|uniref:Uncharacterized protein n=1 Tax=Paraburkholderia fungorum TaxID=134537 RepID=A0AAU8TDC3_9BURK|nr:hypothetical protein OI25_2982 [Paraburkholderia fungorum]PZR45664.1 MAG: hypothetical protein DI523_20260 [Paraburkholderia fungorum]QLD50018.1 hypothetical protein C9419_13980 [Paraburkholderia fungorum]